ncbi:LOW QUALITY PROTEIN: ECH domain-containing protein, partial [Cephalotus follicularis]
LITISQDKFSNGFDLNLAQAAGSTEARHRLHHMGNSLKRVMAELISLPMPTVITVGFMWALSHDYLLMRSDRGVLYISEVDIGLTLPHYFVALVVAKFGFCSVRCVVEGLEGQGGEAVKMGIKDVAHTSPEMLQEASVWMGEQLASRKWDGDVYAEIRKSLYPELLALLGL